MRAAPSTSECVKVMVRIRPMSEKERSANYENITRADKAINQIVLKKPGKGNEPAKEFAFDSVFGIDTPQRTIYDEAAFPLVESVLEGYNGTIFAYGQTGCGKTFTMMGPTDQSNPESKGIIPNAFTHIFGSITANAKDKRFLLRCSYLEIYNENILDLLEYNPDNKLELKEDPQKGIYIKGLTSVIVRSVQDIEKTMKDGSVNRHSAETMMNKESSRSHSIFTIYIETAETQADGNERIRAGKLNLVDLAGSERQSKTHAEGARLKEATKINLSLSALGNVISALVDGKSSHIPYRDSKLTRLLQDSLGGNTKTVMIACVSPAEYNYEETLSTLRYAARAKKIENKPHINEDPKDTLLRKYEEEIKALKGMIKKLGEDTVKSIDEPELRGGANPPGDTKLKMLEEEKALLNADKEKMENELKEREKQFISEKEQREKLELMLSTYEQKLLVGGQDFEEREKEMAKKYKDMQQKLKKQKAKEKKLIEEQQKKEEERISKERQYIQSELAGKTELLKDMKQQVESAKDEIADLQREHQEEKEMLIDTIRQQNQEVDFYKKIIEIMCSETELEKVKSKAEWDDESRTWAIPLFIVQNKQISLPKLPRTQAQELIENDKKSRELNFVGEVQKAEKISREKGKNGGTTNGNSGNNPHNGVQEKSKKIKAQASSALASAPEKCRIERDAMGLGGVTSHKESSVHPTEKRRDKKQDEAAAIDKHLFNWDMINNNKYTNGNEKKGKNLQDSPGTAAALTALRKNVHLDSLPYNPANNLMPINEEDVKQKVNVLEQPAGALAPLRKNKILTKIDENLLSSAARIQQMDKKPMDQGMQALKSSPGIDHGNKGIRGAGLGAVGKVKPIFVKQKSGKLIEEEEESVEE